jgi:toxin ParE1/3/4
MKKLKIVYHEEAIADLEEIWLYTFETWLLEQADRYYDLIIKEIQFISQKPLSGKDLKQLRLGYHSSKVKSHFIFYKFSDTELEVIRILHESMDIPNKL